MIVLKDDPRKIINNHISLNVRQLFGEAIVDAYKFSTLLQQNNPQLRSIRGLKRLLPEIKNVSIEYFLTRTIKNNNLPFQYKHATNSNRSHPFIEIYNDDMVLHVNQVRTKGSCARKAYVRDKLIKPVKSYMLFNMDDLDYEDRYYFQLNHGYQTEEPLFITLGIPNQDYKLEGSISLLEEYSIIKGTYPTSKIETIEEDFFSEFQQFAEGDEFSEEAK